MENFCKFTQIKLIIESCIPKINTIGKIFRHKRRYSFIVNDNDKILELNGLTVAFGERAVVRDLSYTLYRGRTLGIVGESGSGKSVSSMALMGLLPKTAKVTGNAWFSNGSDKRVDLLALSEKELRHYRGNHIAMIFQEPMTSLNPVQKCGAQVVEMLQLHEKVSHKEARERVIELFNEVLLPRPEKIFDRWLLYAIHLY